MNQIKDVQPIRSKQQLEDMEWALKKFCGMRDFILFYIGCNTGLRCSDILSIKTVQVLKLKNKRDKTFKVIERKTKKVRTVNLTAIWEDIYKYAAQLNSETLFPSRKGDNPITRTQAYRQLNKAAFFVDMEHIGTHTMRKTFGYWFYKKTKNIAMLQGILNHSSQEITLKYIGITDEETEQELDGFNVFD